MAKHVDTTQWTHERLGCAYLDKTEALKKVEQRLSSMTTPEGISPETRFANHVEELKKLKDSINDLGDDFRIFKALTLIHMDWMVTQLKWKEDDLVPETGGDLQKEYSKELTAAIAFINELKGN